jgi:GDP-L-fucose synthase
MKNLISKSDSIFVAGHNGLAGSAICRALKKFGYKNILTVSRKELNLRDQIKVKNWFKENSPDIVILAAAKVGGILANSIYPYDFIIENIQIQTNVIESAFQNSVKRLLFLSSSCAYPKECSQPIKEEYLLSNYLEKTNENYALAKIVGMKFCEALRKQKNFDAFSLMPTNLYGPNDNYQDNKSHVFAALIKKFVTAEINNLDQVVCWGDGSPKREFLHVDDLADASVFCLENFQFSLNNCSFLNVGTGKDISIFDLAMLIKNKVGFKGSIIWDKTKPNGTPLKRLDITRIEKLGWKNKISLEEGIEKTINEFKKNINLIF